MKNTERMVQNTRQLAGNCATLPAQLKTAPRGACNTGAGPTEEPNVEVQRIMKIVPLAPPSRQETHLESDIAALTKKLRARTDDLNMVYALEYTHLRPAKKLALELPPSPELETLLCAIERYEIAKARFIARAQQ
jgi:hypothetical protein